METLYRVGHNPLTTAHHKMVSISLRFGPGRSLIFSTQRPNIAQLAGPGLPADNPIRGRQIAPDSVDAVARGHDISWTVDPGHCSGARYGRAAKHRSVHRAS